MQGAEPQSDRFLKKLQEAISTIIEGFKLLDKVRYRSIAHDEPCYV